MLPCGQVSIEKSLDQYSKEELCGTGVLSELTHVCA